ncbi:MAG: NB-ARC domain-containing protein, partial [Chloroflexota bacterium]
YDVWWDRESMPSRALTFLDEIQEAIEKSSRLILVVGDAIHDSDYVKAEWQFALSRCIPVIPILRKGNRQTVPDVLRQVHTPKFLDDDAFDEQIAELKRILTDNDVPLGTLYGVPPLSDNYIQREILDEVQAKLLVETTKPLVVTSAKQQTVSVHGVGGIGKTTLSCALARSCDVRRHFPDGVFFIEVGKKPDLLARMAAIGAIFGDDRQQYIDMNAAAQRLSAILADKHALLVLDDVWEHGHAKVFQVAHTRCRLLVTTRIRGLLTTLNMQSAGLSNLTESEGLDLIAKRVSDEERTVTVAELPEECKALISLVEGHTLAVSLIAARLTKHEGGLDYAPRLLSRLEKGKYFRTLQLNETDKNHNLELSLRLSYDDLGEDLQRRFRALGVLASDGTFDEALAMALWGDEDADDTDDALTDLVRKGLLRREDKNRYGQHGLLRAYALALLTEADERDDTFVRYADYVTAVARQFLILPPQEWSQLDDDIPFIQHVGDQLAEAFDTREEWQDLALRFAVNTKNYVFRRPEIHRLTWLEMG